MCAMFVEALVAVGELNSKIVNHPDETDNLIVLLRLFFYFSHGIMLLLHFRLTTEENNFFEI